MRKIVACLVLVAAILGTVAVVHAEHGSQDPTVTSMKSLRKPR